MTNVLLIFPTPSVSSPQKGPPLSILHIGEALRQADNKYAIRYHDQRYDGDTPDLDWADVVGVTSMVGGQLGRAIQFLKNAKAYGKRTIIGGVFATMQAELCLAEDYIDCVVSGPGEASIVEAVESSGKQIIAHPLRYTDQVSPVNEHTQLHFERAIQKQSAMLMTSRGCLHHCSFCYNQSFYNRHWLSVDLERWKSDVLLLRSLGMNNIEAGDDWIGGWNRAKQIVGFLTEHGINYVVGLRANQIDDDVAREMNELGARRAIIGMESGSQRLLDLCDKGITLSDQIQCAESLARYNIHPQYTWIFGLPTETPQEFRWTLDQIDRVDKIHHGDCTQPLFAYRPFPGSALWDLVDKSKLPQTLDEWGAVDIGYSDNPLANAIYHVTGLVHHRGKGDKTAKNFPGLKRVLIAPFEWLALMRWKLRYFNHYRFERKAIERLLKWASR
jgi:anaerobic magnesium-protoporphyrin IX monomethyl ester cyclase